MLDDARWPAASALIDEACGLAGSGLLVGKGTNEHAQLCRLGIHYRGKPREDLEREYLEDYHPADERVPRFRRLADGLLVHVRDLYTAEELKTSPTYNEMLRRADVQNGLNVRLEVPERLLHRMVHREPRRFGRLDVFADREAHRAAASPPAVHPRAAGARAGRSPEHDQRQAAREPPDRGDPTRRARTSPGSQRPRPQHPAARRRAVGPGRHAGRPRGRRPGAASSNCWPPHCRTRTPPRSPGRSCSAARPCCRRSWCT